MRRDRRLPAINSPRWAVAAALWLALAPGGRGGAAEPPAGEAAAAADRTEEECVGCHGDRRLLASEEDREHYIDPTVFAATTHGEAGCTSCHTAVTTDHPREQEDVEKAECSTCHEETATEYGASKHADDAVCTDCHNPHAVKAPDVLTSVQMNEVCTRCHEHADLVDKHAPWLPQLEYHLAALPCITCHTGAESYVITMYIERVGGDGRPVGRSELELLRPAGKPITAILDSSGDGKVSLDELRRFSRVGRARGLRLQAMMMPDEVTHTYQILRNRYDCTFCHARGTDRKQKAFVALPEPGDRTYKRMAVQEGAILDLLYGTPDFYMIGASATRSRAMNLAALGLLGVGIVFVAGHSFVRLLTRSRRRSGRSSS